MRPASIRFRITAIAVLAVAVVLTLAGIAVVISQRSQLTATVDASLRQRADDIAALMLAADPTPAAFGEGREDGFAQLLDDRGSVLATSPNLVTPLLTDRRVGDAATIRTLSGLPMDDDSFRVLTRTVSTPAGPALLHVGTTNDPVDESTEALTTSLAVSIPIVVVVLGVLVWWLVGHTLRPVEEIRAEVAAIGAGGLDRRVPVPETNDEIAQLAATMNSMLARLEESVSRQQQFVADASHELRSPLTRLRAEIEVGLIDADASARARLESLHKEVIDLQDLVESLLHLARTDADQTLVAVRVDLDDLVLEVARDLRAGGRVAVDTAEVQAVQVDGDSSQLARAIRNVAENAARYASSRVQLALAEIAAQAIVTVTDDGPGIPAAAAERIFERFGRADDSRTRGGGGSGLGLAIAREIVERHGGTVAVDTAYDAGARILMGLPSAGATS